MQIKTRELFQSIHTEGGLLPPDLLQRIAESDPGLRGLTADSYHLAADERLRETISRAWNRLLGAWTAFDTARGALATQDTGAQLTRDRWLHLVFDELGYGRLVRRPAIEIEGKSYPIFTEWQHTPIHVVGCNIPLDRRTKGVVGAAGQSPHSLVQELLNRSPERLWGIVSNGLRLRLVRDNVTLTRQAYVEFDLEAMLTGEAYSDFVVLWLVCHQSRVEAERPEDCWLERWSKAGSQQGTRALDALRIGVEDAIATLGGGFLAHPANHALHEALRDGTLNAQEYYRQLLRLVYRLLFLFVAEDREALFDPTADETARERYLRHYSTCRLRTLALRRRGGRPHDLYVGLTVVMDALGGVGCKQLSLPGLGSYLWSRDALGFLAEAHIANSELLAAVRALAWIEEAGVRRAVDFRNLGAEELGSVYESLLELHPELDRETATFTLDTSGGNERKTTGSYYTPTELITALLDSALNPVVDDAVSTDDPEKAILELSVCDPACGSGHFLIAAANRIGKRLAAIRTEEPEPGPEDLRHAVRDVIGRCIYGVDVNPMAVELCKVSLWMEAMDPGRPLSFLDDRIVCGNSLIGTTPELIGKGIPADAFKPMLGDVKEVVSELRKRNASELKGRIALDLSATLKADTRALADRSAAITRIADNSLRGVRTRERQFQDLVASPELERERLLADVWCAAFVALRRPGEPSITQDALVRVAQQGAVGLSDKERELVEGLRSIYGFHHWHIEFPAVFAAGGFDVVLGNPPWEHTELKEKEFFAIRVPAIANASTGAARKRMIEALVDDDPDVYESFVQAKRQSDSISRFVRDSGRYPLCGRGRINTYAVFAELMRSVTAPRGRTGAIVPTGIATDDTTKHFFQDVIATRSLVSLYDFENRAGIFPVVDSRIKFSLLTLTGRDRPTGTGANFTFFAQRIEDLDDSERQFTLTTDDIALVNPNTRTCPVFRTRRDAELTKAIYRRVPVLVRESDLDRNPWNITLKQGLFNMTSDSHLFRTCKQLQGQECELRGNVFIQGEERWLPLYEAKMLHHFDHRWATYNNGDTRLMTDAEKHAPGSVAMPRYWVTSAAIRQGTVTWTRDWLLGWRRNARNTDERTLIADVVGAVAVGDSIFLAFPTSDAAAVAGLLAILNSFVTDFVVRQKVGGTNMSFYLVEQFPIPTPTDIAPMKVFLSRRVLELTYTATDLAGFAADLGYDGPPFGWNPERRALIRAELDAAIFRLYGIERDDVEYIMETFPIVRRHDEERYGEYQTKRLILERYDAMANADSSGRNYETSLDPPPADPSLAHVPRIERPRAATIIQFPFERVENPSDEERFNVAVPIVSLKAAAGAFGSSAPVESEGWARLPDINGLKEGMFVTQALGSSMEPHISDGAWCLFSHPAGDPDGKIVLVQHRAIEDPETGGTYVVKRYRHSSTTDAGQLWNSKEVILESLNPDYAPIVLAEEDDGGIRVIAEFVRVVG